MSLADLPEEILIIIIRDLDLCTLESLYNTCKRLRNTVCMLRVVKEGHMSCNVMATATKLKSPFFKVISDRLLELNMCGVPDLNKSLFLPALKRLTNLKVLDVSYTNIHVADLLGIDKICPALKDITINLTCCECSKVSKNSLMQCQSVFQHFDNIHFVGSIIILLHSKIALYLIAKSTLHSLKFTIADHGCTNHLSDQDYQDYLNFPHFNKFTIYILNWNLKKSAFIPVMDNMRMTELPILSMLQLYKYEYIVILIIDFKPKIYASPIFDNFFKDNFNVEILNMERSEIKMFGNSAVMMWNRETTRFDKAFFDKLIEYIKQYIPNYFLLANDLEMPPDPAKRDWFYNVPRSHVCEKYKNQMIGVSRKRKSVSAFVLNYDELFKEKDRLELTLEFKQPINTAISLTKRCTYLNKLTYLSLIGLGRFSADFFNVLFHCCKNLETLNVQTLPAAPCILAVSRSLPISTSLKNIRLVQKRVGMKTLFAAFSQCPNLENIHILDDCINECNNLADPTAIIEKCDRLYSVYLEAQLTDATKTKITRMFNKAKTTYNKQYINVTIQKLGVTNPRTYDPFVDVFRLSPIRPLKYNV